MSHDTPVAIAIPVLDRPAQIGPAIEAALAQSHPDCLVIAIDDGSKGGAAGATWAAMRRFAPHPRVALIRLARNLGTGRAKNVAIALAGRRAISFHDSDDRPHTDKLLRQSRVLALRGLRGDAGLNWGVIGRAAGAELQIGAVFCHHDLILPDGSRRTIRREISMVDDLFPNAQPEPAAGDWLHINSGLFAPAVFRELGGYADSIEEDRDLRNRLLMSGQILRVIEEPLLTKIETAGSLTLSPETGYDSPRRRADRHAIWRAVEDWFATRRIAPRPIDLPHDCLAEITNPAALALSEAAMTAPCRAMLAAMLSAMLAEAPASPRPAAGSSFPPPRSGRSAAGPTAEIEAAL